MIAPPTKFELAPLPVIENERQMTAARFSPDGKLLAAAGYDARLYFWRSGEEAFDPAGSMEGHSGWISECVFAPDSARCYTADTWGQLQAWTVAASASGEQPIGEPAWQVADAHDGWIRDIAVSSDGRWLASCGRDQRVCLWNAQEGKLERTWTGHDADVFRVAFHPSQPRLVSGDLKGAVHIWDLEQKDAAQEAGDASAPPLRSLDASELYLYHRIQEVGGVRSLAFDAQGKQLAVGGTRPKGGGNVQGVPLVLIFDWESGKLQHTRELGGSGDVYVCDLQFHPEGFLIAATSGNPGTGQLIFCQPDQEKPFLIDKKIANCHSVSLHGDRLAVAGTNRGSNGNGRRLDKDGNYLGNSSPIQVYRLKPEAEAK